jgi:VWFA-related protein
MRLIKWMVLSIVCGLVLVNEVPGKPQQPAQAPEISARNADAQIKVRVNLVLVRVVARDANGKAVAGLKKEDFQLMDEGKEQKISTFSVETPDTRVKGAAATTVETKETETGTEKNAEGAAVAIEANVAGADSKAGTAGVVKAIPQRYVALVFDDVHMKQAEQTAVHAATEKLFASLAPTDRVAIYSTSGKVNQDFTSDVAGLRKALVEIVPHGRQGEGEHACPSLSYYQADLIVNKHNQEALVAAEAEAMVDCHLTQNDVIAAADRVLRDADQQTRNEYQFLESIVRRMGDLPGQRVIALVSPGYELGDEVQQNNWDFIDQAMRAAIVVNTIDARGLYTAELLRDIDAPPQQSLTRNAAGRAGGSENDFDYQSVESTYRTQAQFQAGQVLAGLAASTGGTYFHNRNDLEAGMNEAMAAPSVSYLLGFSPQNLRVDGKFHKLKVILVNGQKYQIQTRNGYYAPKQLADPEEMAKQEVREALFSQDEIVDIPVELKTQSFKVDAGSSQLTVFTHLDVRKIHFRKAEGRSYNNVVLATALFDDNGQFVDGQMREIALKLQDSTMERLNATGFTIKIVFTVRRGTYLVRSVVRGSEGEQLTARNVMAVIAE